MTEELGLLTCKEVARLVRASERAIWAWVRSGRFVRPIRLGRRAVRWRPADIEKWIAEQVPASPSKTEGGGQC